MLKAMRAALALLLLAAPALADEVGERFRQGDALIDAGDYAGARARLDSALGELRTADARMVRYHERTGASLLREGKVKEARASFTAALKAAQRLKAFGDDAARAYAGMGLCLRREKNDRYAARFLQKALEHNPDEGTRMFVEDELRDIEGKPPVAPL